MKENEKQIKRTEGIVLPVEKRTIYYYKIDEYEDMFRSRNFLSNQICFGLIPEPFLLIYCKRGAEIFI